MICFILLALFNSLFRFTEVTVESCGKILSMASNIKIEHRLCEDLFQF